MTMSMSLEAAGESRERERERAFNLIGAGQDLHPKSKFCENFYPLLFTNLQVP